MNWVRRVPAPPPQLMLFLGPDGSRIAGEAFVSLESHVIVDSYVAMLLQRKKLVNLWLRLLARPRFMFYYCNVCGQSNDFSQNSL